MITYMFPGQGSQKKGMGQELFDRFPEEVKKADEVLGYSIKELCLEDPENHLNKTQYTQPALYIVSALDYFRKVQEEKVKPDFVAGHSLGEYNALLAAGVFDFETGLKLVKKRGELMSQVSDGAMAAVLKIDEEKIRQVLKDNELDTIDVANYNSKYQTVISGKKEDINGAKSLFTAQGAVYAKLKVSAAFHSRYMESVKEDFGKYLEQFTFKTPEITVISNVTARPYADNEIKENMKDQLCSSVRWLDSVKYLLEEGCDTFEEVGPGDVLTKLVKRIREEY